MKKKCLLPSLLGLITIFSFTFSSNISVSEKPLASTNQQTIDSSITNIYDSLHLENLGLSRQVFDYALEGHNELVQSGQLKKSNMLSIVDFSLPSTAKRLFIIDLENCKLLFNTYVSHGRNSGENIATSFSNEPESFKSSLGFYSTASTYAGKHGYSLQLQGMEKGFNDKALSRGIVMHAADYVCESVAKSQGRIGRSLGCPAVPEKLHTAIIAAIANGSCLFMYANDNNYLKHSALLHTAKFRLTT